MALQFLYDGYFAGKVGIGTESPGASLEIGNLIADAAGLKISSPGSEVNVDFSFIIGDTSLSLHPKNLVIKGSSGSSDIAFSPSSSYPALMVLDGSAGRVGIGTTTPGAKLDVAGDIRLNSIGQELQFSNHSVGAYRDVSNRLMISGYGGIRFQAEAVGGMENQATRMVINPSGNVGIGTTSPDQKLQVGGNFHIYDEVGNTDASLFMTTGSSDTTTVKIASNGTSYLNGGNVGIGTTSPNNGKLVIDSTANQIAIETGAAGDGRLNIGHFSNGTFIGTYGDDGGAADLIRFGTHSGDERMRITSTGGISFGSTGTAYGTSGQILKSNGNASPTWIDGSAIPGVPAGSGTLNTVAMWTPDGDTLGDSPITISGSNSTFAGGITATYGTFSGGVNADYFRTLSSNTNYNLFTRNNTGNTIFVQAAQSNASQPIAKFSYGSATVNAGTAVLQVSKDNSHFVNCNVGIGVTSPTRKLSVEDSSSSIIADFKYSAAAYSSIDLSNNTSFARLSSVNSDLLLSPAGSEKMRVTSSGNVGIGTTSPGAKLEISKSQDTTFIITSSYNGSWATQNYGHIEFKSEDLSGTTDPRAAITGLQFSNGAYGGLGFSTHGLSGSLTEAMRIDSAGNVGIGTTSPGAKLDVIGGSLKVSDTYATVKIIGTGGLSRVFLGDTADEDVGYLEYNHISNYFRIGVNAAERMRIDSSGNVGIGTTSPDYDLEVESTADADLFSIKSTATTNNTQMRLGISGNDSVISGTGGSSGNLVFKTYGSERMRIDTAGAIKFNAYDSTNNTGTPTYLLGTDGSGNIVKTLPQGSGTAGPYLPLAGGTMTGTGNIDTPDQFKLRFGAGNDFQIYHQGGTSGSYINNYSGNMRFNNYGNDTDIVFQNDDGSGGTTTYLTLDGGTTHAYFSNPGNVGIGNTSPGAKLVVGANVNTAATGIEVNAGANGANVLNAGSADNWFPYSDANNYYSASEHIFRSELNGSTRMTIKSDGKVGIGIILPTEKLEVVGNIKITAALLSNQENTDVDTGTEVVGQVLKAIYTAAFFDFVIKKGTNIRSGTVYACHDGTNVEFTETSTNDLGDTSDVTLSVDLGSTTMRLLATTTSDDWSVKSLIRAI